MEKYYGKYRALVSKNVDPLKMGRIKVSCPLVLGDSESNWCIPCLPVIFPEIIATTTPVATTQASASEGSVSVSVTVVAEIEVEVKKMLVIPKVNSGVWIEFESGDLNKPIWVGMWIPRGLSELPLQP